MKYATSRQIHEIIRKAVHIEIVPALKVMAREITKNRTDEISKMYYQEAVRLINMLDYYEWTFTVDDLLEHLNISVDET